MLVLNFLSLVRAQPHTCGTGIFVVMKRLTAVMCCFPVVRKTSLVWICSFVAPAIFAYDLTGVFYYMSALPTIALFGLKLNRLSAFLGCLVMFSLYAMIFFIVAVIEL
jgi:hypothetical protein